MTTPNLEFTIDIDAELSAELEADIQAINDELAMLRSAAGSAVDSVEQLDDVDLQDAQQEVRRVDSEVDDLRDSVRDTDRAMDRADYGERSLRDARQNVEDVADETEQLERDARVADTSLEDNTFGAESLSNVADILQDGPGGLLNLIRGMGPIGVATATTMGLAFSAFAAHVRDVNDEIDTAVETFRTLRGIALEFDTTLGELERAAFLGIRLGETEEQGRQFAERLADTRAEFAVRAGEAITEPEGARAEALALAGLTPQQAEELARRPLTEFANEFIQILQQTAPEQRRFIADELAGSLGPTLLGVVSQTTPEQLTREIERAQAIPVTTPEAERALTELDVARATRTAIEDQLDRLENLPETVRQRLEEERITRIRVDDGEFAATLAGLNDTIRRYNPLQFGQRDLVTGFDFERDVGITREVYERRIESLREELREVTREEQRLQTTETVSPSQSQEVQVEVDVSVQDDLTEVGVATKAGRGFTNTSNTLAGRN